ncbi:MAG: TetR/AcrR family transcriptional regulator C-terminal domain-containing protein [Lachnospiraceae bacterium]|nr:TetR/AcrR family transcriptional regulator C-terminal domain-containing protein [Lachnospiraceae bacterium]
MTDKYSLEERLAESLKSLAARMPFDKITIKQITDGAGVIRVTFYNHFQDKYDLLEWIVREQILSPVRVLISNHMFRETMVLIFRNLQKDKEFYTHAVKIEGQNSFAELGERTFYEFLYGIFSELITKENPEHPWLTAEYLAKYYAVSMNFVVMEWIRADMIADPEEMATVYEYIATRSMWNILEELN